MPTVAKLLMTVAIAVYTFIPPLADLFILSVALLVLLAGWVLHRRSAA